MIFAVRRPGGWSERAALDGLIAKRLDQPCRPSERAMGMKQRRTAEFGEKGGRADCGPVRDYDWRAS